jgi:hypothetical protein
MSRAWATGDRRGEGGDFPFFYLTSCGSRLSRTTRDTFATFDDGRGGARA